MESIAFDAAPVFQSAEEEIAYLRAHIAQKEATLRSEGNNTNIEAVAHEAVVSYSETPIAQVIPEARQMPEEQAQKLVLELTPETHDRTIEALFGVMMQSGIKNALQIVQELNNPHVADDFHRFLVQYLVAVKVVPGLREDTPIQKGITMRLFEVTLPGEDMEEKGHDFKQAITAMEQLYTGIIALGGKNNSLGNYISFEVALHNEGSQVMFYVAIPSAKVDLFEKQLLSFYTDAKMKEVTDDYNIFTEEGVTVASYAKFEHLEVYPLRTHDNIDHDPMSSLVNAFSKLKHVGEGVAVQFIVRPESEMMTQEVQQILKQVKDGVKPSRAYNSSRSFLRATGHALGDVVTEMFDFAKGEKHVNDQAVQNITKKIERFVMRGAVRIVASAETESRALDILRELEAVFSQFADPLSNSFTWERVSGSRKDTLLHDFSYRILNEDELMMLNVRELASLFHFPVGVKNAPQLKSSQATTAPVPLEMQPGAPGEGVYLGVNEYRGVKKDVFMRKDDRVRHTYVIGQTGTGKTVFLKNMIIQDIHNGEGVCFIDPHGSDIQDILANIPAHRLDDVIYFDPAYTARPMGLNMLEYDVRYPEQKTFVVNELLAIFNKLFDMKTAGGPAFEQYFRNSALLVMEDPDSGMTLLEIGRVLADKEFRDLKLSRCKNPIIKQFWENAEKTTGEQSLANFVPYVTNKFDVFISNDIMRPVIAQEKSVFNFRKVMDERKILLVNLSKGRLGDINANLIGLILVGKITMAALSRVDILGKGVVHDFYLYIDEFQNITTDSIEVILSEARKYRLSLNVAHQYIEQLEENIKNAVFGNVGTMVVHRISTENAEVFAKSFDPVFTPSDIIKLENLNCYVKMLVNGVPVKPFNSKTPFPPKGNPDMVDKIKELSYLTYGRDRAEVEAEIMERYNKI